MKRKFSRVFLSPGPLAFVGYSSKQLAYCEGIVEALSRSGFAVQPVALSPPERFSRPVVASLGSLPGGTDQAFVLPSGSKALAIVEELGGLGYKRVLLRSEKLSPQAHARALELGMEVASGCPLMVYGRGMHRFHGLLAGVR